MELRYEITSIDGGCVNSAQSVDPFNVTIYCYVHTGDKYPNRTLAKKITMKMPLTTTIEQLHEVARSVCATTYAPLLANLPEGWNYPVTVSQLSSSEV